MLNSLTGKVIQIKMMVPVEDTKKTGFFSILLLKIKLQDLIRIMAQLLNMQLVLLGTNASRCTSKGNLYGREYNIIF